MLWKWIALMRFAPFPTINSVSSNATELRRLSRNVVGFPMENGLTMQMSEVASKPSNSNEECEQPQGCTPRKPPARGPAVAEFKDRSPSELQRRGGTRV
jgi:hypothetical protein